MKGMVSTTCPYCGVGCGVLAGVEADGATRVKGDPAHASNHGRLCVKGAALGDTVGLEGRLLHPMRRHKDGTLHRTGWDEAVQYVADGFARIIAEHGPDAVAFYVSGQLLTEDYYVVSRCWCRLVRRCWAMSRGTLRSLIRWSWAGCLD